MILFPDVCYCETHRLYLDLYLPECQNFPVFVYFHGGGLERGDKANQQVLYRFLTAHGIKPSDIAGYLHDAGQPTCHYNVLRERGLDTRRVITDESAPLYHIDDSRSYPPMHIIVSDNDMENRYEQTMLLMSTLKHFGHRENVTLTVMQGKHCAYVRAVDARGDSVLGKLVLELIHP